MAEKVESVSAGKIVQMLTQIQGEVTLEKHIIETQYKKFSCWADSTNVKIKHLTNIFCHSFSASYKSCWKYIGFKGEFSELMERAQAQQEEAEATIQAKVKFLFSVEQNYKINKTQKVWK